MVAIACELDQQGRGEARVVVAQGAKLPVMRKDRNIPSVQPAEQIPSPGLFAV